MIRMASSAPPSNRNIPSPAGMVSNPPAPKSIIHVLAIESEKRRKLEHQKRLREKRQEFQERKPRSRPSTASKSNHSHIQNLIAHPIRLPSSNQAGYTIRSSSPTRATSALSRISSRPVSGSGRIPEGIIRHFGDKRRLLQEKTVGPKTSDSKSTGFIDYDSSSSDESDWHEYFTARPNTAYRSEPSTRESSPIPPKVQQRPQSSRRIFHSSALLKQEGNQRVIKAEHVEIIHPEDSDKKTLPSIFSVVTASATTPNTPSQQCAPLKSDVHVFDLTPNDEEFGNVEDKLSSRRLTTPGNLYSKFVGWAQSSVSASSPATANQREEKPVKTSKLATKLTNQGSSRLLNKKDTLGSESIPLIRQESEGSISGVRPAIIRPASARPQSSQNRHEKTPIPPSHSQPARGSLSMRKITRVSSARSEATDFESRRESTASSVQTPDDLLNASRRSRSAHFDSNQNQDRVMLKHEHRKGSHPILHGRHSPRTTSQSTTTSVFGSQSSTGKKTRPFSSNASISLPPLHPSRIPRQKSAPPVRRRSSTKEDTSGRIKINQEFVQKAMSEMKLEESENQIPSSQNEDLMLFSLAEQLSKRGNLKVTEIEEQLQRAEKGNLGRLTTDPQNENHCNSVSRFDVPIRDSTFEHTKQFNDSTQKTSPAIPTPPQTLHSSTLIPKRRGSTLKLRSDIIIETEKGKGASTVSVLEQSKSTDTRRPSISSPEDEEEAMILQALSEFNRILSSKMQILNDLSQKVHFSFRTN